MNTQPTTPMTPAAAANSNSPAMAPKFSTLAGKTVHAEVRTDKNGKPYGYVRVQTGQMNKTTGQPIVKTAIAQGNTLDGFSSNGQSKRPGRYIGVKKMMAEGAEFSAYGTYESSPKGYVFKVWGRSLDEAERNANKAPMMAAAA